MSRTFKSKEAQRKHKLSGWNKAYGYLYDWGYVDMGDYYYIGIYPLTTKREIFEKLKYEKFKTAHHQRKNCVKGEDKRIVNKKHRANVRKLIQQYVSGRNEDVLTTAVGPRNPMEYWS